MNKTLKPIITEDNILGTIHNAISDYEKFKRSGPLRVGICDRIAELVKDDVSYSVVIKYLSRCLMTWEHFSGDITYPIPLTLDYLHKWKVGPDNYEPEHWAYRNCSLWEGKQEQARISLCKHIQRCIREHLEEKGCKFEEIKC